MPLRKYSLPSPRIGAAAGMIGPVMFLGTLAILDVLDHRIDVSGHEVGHYGIVQYLNFFLFGLLLSVFAAALRNYIRRGRLGGAGAVLLWVFSLGPLLATFTLDTAPGPPSTWHGVLHSVGFLLFSLTPIPTCFVFAFVFRGDPRWRRFSWYSLATAIAVTAVVFAPSTSGGDAYPIWTGPASKMEQILVLAWLELVAIQLRRLSGVTSVQRAGQSFAGGLAHSESSSSAPLK